VVLLKYGNYHSLSVALCLLIYFFVQTFSAQQLKILCCSFVYKVKVDFQVTDVFILLVIYRSVVEQWKF